MWKKNLGLFSWDHTWYLSHAPQWTNHPHWTVVVQVNCGKRIKTFIRKCQTLKTGDFDKSIHVQQIQGYQSTAGCILIVNQCCTISTCIRRQWNMIFFFLLVFSPSETRGLVIIMFSDNFLVMTCLRVQRLWLCQLQILQHIQWRANPAFLRRGNRFHHLWSG